MSEPLADTFRWQALFQKASEPLFLISQRQRIVFVNRAWEACTGLKLAEVRGRACRRLAANVLAAVDDAILSACLPPAEALELQSCQVRRRSPLNAGWWEIRYFPIAGADGVFAILGSIRVLAEGKVEPYSLPDKLMALRDLQARRYRFEHRDDAPPALQRLRQQASLSAQTRVPITLVGEAGAGKEWLARAIHQSSGKGGYFACVDGDHLPASFVVEQLSGNRARQTGVRAVYLREPAAISKDVQTQLIELAKGHDNADAPRLIFGFQRDPRLYVQTGRLLEALYLAISPVTITIPPLRERQDELSWFVDVFLRRWSEWPGQECQRLSTDALAVLRSYDWPGNLRELQSVLQSACRRTKGRCIEAADLPFHLRSRNLPAERRLPLDKLLEQVERRLLTLALKLTKGNQTRAAELLEIWRPRLVRRMEKFGIDS